MGILQRGADGGLSHTPLMSVCHPLYVHRLLVIRAVVVHDAQERNVMVGGRPQNARGVHQVAVVLNRYGEPAVPAVGQRTAYRSRRAVADTVPAPPADEAVVLVEVP